MTSYKKLILILCALSSSCQTGVAMDMNALNDLLTRTWKKSSSTAQNQWQQHPYLYTILASLSVAGLLRELNNKYKISEKSSKEIAKKLTTVTKFINQYFLLRTLAQPIKIPVDLAKGSWNTMVVQNPEITDSTIHVMASALGLTSSFLISGKFINSSFFAEQWKDVVGSALSERGKTYGTFGLSFALAYPCMNLIYNLMRAPILGDKTVRYENLMKGKSETGSPLKEVDLDEHTYFGELPEGIRAFIKNSSDPQAPRSFLTYGVPGNGKTVAAVEAAQQAGATKIYQYHAASANDRYMNGTAANLSDVVQEFITKAKEDPSTIYALIIDEIDEISANRTKTDVGARDDAKVTTTFIKLMDEAEELPNVLIFGTTNLVSDVDDAIARRFKKHETLNSPSNERRKEILVGYIKHNGCTIAPDALEHVLRCTLEFPTYAIKNIAYDICSQIKEASITEISLSNPFIINKSIAEQLQHLIDKYTRAQHKIRKSGDESALTENLREYDRCIQVFKTSLSDLHKKFFELELASKQAELKDAKTQNNTQSIVKLTHECLELLEKQQKSLPKTPEQKVFEQMLKDLDKGDMQSFQKELEKFDPKKSLFQTSLQKQVDVLGSIIFELKELTKFHDSQTLNKLDLCEKIKKHVAALTTELTYRMPTSPDYPAEQTQQKLCARIVEYCSDTSKDCTKILEDLEELKKNKSTLKEKLYEHVLDLQQTAENDIPLAEKIAILKHEITKLSNMIMTDAQRKIQVLINEIAIEKQTPDFDDKAVAQILLQEDISIVETKQEVPSRSLTTKTKPEHKRTGSLDGLELRPRPTAQQQPLTCDVETLVTAEQELKKFKKLAKQQYQRTGGFWWIPFSGYFCKAPKASAEEKTVSYIALFLQKLFAGMQTVGSSTPTVTPESLIVTAQTLQEKSPEARTKNLCALVAGYKHNDKQTIELFTKKECSQQEVIKVLDSTSNMLYLKDSQDTDVQDADALWHELNKEHFEKESKKYSISLKVPGQQPKKVEDSAKLFAISREFDKIVQIGRTSK